MSATTDPDASAAEMAGWTAALLAKFDRLRTDSLQASTNQFLMYLKKIAILASGMPPINERAMAVRSPEPVMMLTEIGNQ